MKISVAIATGLLLAIRATRTFGAPMSYSSLSLALTGVVPAACDAEAGEFHEGATRCTTRKVGAEDRIRID